MEIVVFDTNVLIDDPKAPLKFPDSLVVIPRIVLEELDKLKTGKDGNVRRMSRLASNLIDGLSEEHQDKINIPLENGSFIRVESGYMTEFESSEPDKPDNKIISVALGYAKNREEGETVTLYSNDTNVRVVARQLAKDNFPELLSQLPLKAKAYEQIDSSLHDISSGVTDLIISDVEMSFIRKNNYLDYDLPYLNGEHLMLQGESNPQGNTALAQWDAVQGKILLLPDYKKGDVIWNIGGGQQGSSPVRPRDSRQAFLAHDILNPDKHLHFVLSRVAGAGKNFITTACGLKLLKDGHYDRLLVIKPMVSVDGQDLGYLPGDKSEKLAPFFESFNDTIIELTNDRGLGYDLEARIELDVVTHMRGRSIPRTIIIIDEAQNFSSDALKTLLTRAGEDTKIIIMGDLSQIDNLRLDAGNTGLRVWADRARHHETGYANSTYILLDSNFRSELSAWASSFYE
ncbi:PhoH family protein [Paenibacillus illinoisensis]|uniref:PhoH family protein n=1 Tax=Paenibacillus illinoisensis TaxID=59845 RepID=UPI00301691BA